MRLYVTTPDRAGLAIAAGGMLAGGIAALLVASGGRHDPSALAVAWLIGTIVAMPAIVAVAGPIWLMLHLGNRRGPGTAAATGMVVALALFAAAQTGGATVSADAATYRWASAIATSLMIALAAAAIGWAMQRIAYRPLP